MKVTDILEGEKADMLNTGYQDGFHGNEPAHKDNEDYMSGYRIGRTDGGDRKRHLRTKKKNKD